MRLFCRYWKRSIGMPTGGEWSERPRSPVRSHQESTSKVKVGFVVETAPTGGSFEVINVAVKRHVVFAGAYGLRNAGDDAPLLVMTEGLRRLHPRVDFRFSVLARHSDPLLAEACGAQFLPNIEYQTRAHAAGKWFRGFNFGDDRGDLERVEATIRDADLVVVGAGNVLIDIAFDLFRGPIPLVASYAFMADLHRTPFMLYGITAGPLHCDRARSLSGWIARHSAVTTCRDEVSARLLREIVPDLRVEVHPDPVLGLKPASDARFEAALKEEGLTRRGLRPRLAIAWRDLEFLDFDVRILVDALRRLAREYELLFLPQCTGADCDDRDIARGIVAQLGDAEVHCLRGRHSPEVLMRFYEIADVTLAARLHGALFSVRSGTPVAGLAYLPKVSSFLATMGLSDHCIDLDEATPARIVSAIDRARRVDGRVLQQRAERLATGVLAYLARASKLLRLGTTKSQRAQQIGIASA